MTYDDKINQEYEEWLNERDRCLAKMPEFSIEIPEPGGAKMEKHYSYDDPCNLHVNGTKGVELFVKQIKGESGDFETAHSDEDKLYEAVLKEVVKGNPEARSMAAEALKTKLIDFARYCA